MPRPRVSDGDAGEPRGRLLTVDEVAQMWQISSRTVRRRIEKKLIRVIRIGRAVRIHPKTAELGPGDTV
jgi:excisionase family DNA binding protein